MVDYLANGLHHCSMYYFRSITMTTDKTCAALAALDRLSASITPYDRHPDIVKQDIDIVRQALTAQAEAQPAPDINTCPSCGGEADNGHDRCDPPNPYNCTKCEAQPADDEVREAVEETDLRMSAYYYGFTPTRVREIDEILSAVACAGKAYHHTDSWNDETPKYEDCFEGLTPIDWIQNAANRAALKIRAATAPNNDSTDTCLYCGASSIVNSRCTRCNATTENYNPNNAVPREVVEKLSQIVQGTGTKDGQFQRSLIMSKDTMRELASDCLALLGGKEGA